MPMPDKPNIVLVCVDCLRTDHVGTDRARTPFIDSMVEDGIQYTNLFSTTTTTTPSVASFLTGQYSESNGIYSLDEADLNDEVTTLAERFSETGYHTTAMVTGPLVKDTHLDRGFDEYHYRDRNEDLLGPWGESASERVGALGEPFFCYLHLWELHEPIEVPPQFDEPAYGATPYARTLSALDRALEALSDALPRDSVVVLHGDHGESLSWRQHLFHHALNLGRGFLRFYLGLDTRRAERWLNRVVKRFEPDETKDQFLEKSHGDNVFDFTANVPLVISESQYAPTVVDVQTRQVDVYPTLLELTDTAPSDEDIDGESLLPPEQIEDRDSYIRASGRSLLRRKNWIRAIRSDEMKYVEYPNRGWAPELYDLRSDPFELNPVSDDRAERRLKRKLPMRELEPKEQLEIDDLLKDLGYA